MTDAAETGSALGYITSHSGRRLTLPHIHPSDIVISDITHALSMQCRYNGHCSSFYSVAEHQVLTCNIAERDHGHGSEVARACLVHDAPEAYVGDFPSPLKAAIPQFRSFERQVAVRVHEALRVPHPDAEIWATVKIYDLHALHLEAATLFSPPPPWVREVPAKYLHPIHCLTPKRARDRLEQKLAEYGYEIC